MSPKRCTVSLFCYYKYNSIFMCGMPSSESSPDICRKPIFSYSPRAYVCASIIFFAANFSFAVFTAAETIFVPSHARRFTEITRLRGA